LREERRSKRLWAFHTKQPNLLLAKKERNSKKEKSTGGEEKAGHQIYTTHPSLRFVSHLRLSQGERHQGGGGEEQEQGSEQHADLEHRKLTHVLHRASENYSQEEGMKGKLVQHYTTLLLYKTMELGQEILTAGTRHSSRAIVDVENTKYHKRAWKNAPERRIEDRQRAGENNNKIGRISTTTAAAG